MVQVKVRAEARNVGMGAARRAAGVRQAEAALASERKALVTQLPSLASAYEAAAPIAQRLTATKGAHQYCSSSDSFALSSADQNAAFAVEYTGLNWAPHV